MLLSDRIILGDTILERINLRLVQFLNGVISKRKKNKFTNLLKYQYVFLSMKKTGIKYK